MRPTTKYSNPHVWGWNLIEVCCCNRTDVYCWKEAMAMRCWSGIGLAKYMQHKFQQTRRLKIIDLICLEWSFMRQCFINVPWAVSRYWVENYIITNKKDKVEFLACLNMLTVSPLMKDITSKKILCFIFDVIFVLIKFCFWQNNE